MAHFNQTHIFLHPCHTKLDTNIEVIIMIKYYDSSICRLLPAFGQGRDGPDFRLAGYPATEYRITDKTGSFYAVYQTRFMTGIVFKDYFTDFFHIYYNFLTTGRILDIKKGRLPDIR